MDFSFPIILLAPLGLGLLGFIEPCTVGGHLVFLQTLAERSRLERAAAILLFAAVRTLTMGAFGAIVGAAGQHLISVQTSLWLVFGAIYVVIGFAYALDRIGFIRRRLQLAPASWKTTANPLVLGFVFGLNIPACAAPILFALIGIAASSGAVIMGFATMTVFGLALSIPLVVLTATPFAAPLASKLSGGTRITRWVFAVIFLALGVWSIWFGIFVDPADWATL